MFAFSTPTTAQLARERSLLVAMAIDGLLIVLLLAVGVVGGSLTIVAECLRGTLMLATEGFALLAMRRIHRGQLAAMEFGFGKIEQAANLVIAAGMLFGAGWICLGALELFVGEQPPASPRGLAAAAIFASLNAYLNFVAWMTVLQVTPPGSPVIMEAQLRSRAVKLRSSGVVLLLLTLSALTIDPVISKSCDVLGALFVAGYIVMNAVEMIRGGIPDLLDRCADEAMQRGINRALARHFEDYDQLQRVRSRRSGKTVFVEIALGFDPRLSFADVDRRMRAIRATFHREIAEADVSIIAATPAAISLQPAS